MVELPSISNRIFRLAGDVRRKRSLFGEKMRAGQKQQEAKNGQEIKEEMKLTMESRAYIYIYLNNLRVLSVGGNKRTFSVKNT